MGSVANGLKRLYPSHIANRSTTEDDKVQFTLQTIIGTTTSSPNGFDYDATRNLFAHCAGPAVVLSELHEDLNITQRLYRARPNAIPIHTTPSYYNSGSLPSTPTRLRYNSPLRDGLYNQGPGGYLEQPTESPNTTKLQSRTREASCLSLSNVGDLLAVGETGYNPRVLIFSIAAGASADTPSSLICDHSFGIKSVAFSPDCKWLCSLGSAQDGFLLLYSINFRSGSIVKLHSSNKCSNVNGVTWMKSSIVSYGSRHVRLWRVEAPSSPRKPRPAADNSSPALGPKILSGQNVILGDLLDDNFQCAVSIGDFEVVLGTSRGNVCILDETSKSANIQNVAHMPFAIHSLYFDHRAEIVWLAGQGGKVHSIGLKDLKARQTPRLSIAVPTPDKGIDSTIVAIGHVRGLLMTVSDQQIAIMTPKMETSEPPEALLKTFPAHQSPVLGICPVSHWKDRSEFLTYSARGSVLFWQYNGECVGRLEIPLDQPSDPSGLETNELKALAVFGDQETLLAGDKLGVLHWLTRSGETLQSIRAHSGEINGIAATSGDFGYLTCTCGRDRTLQLFRAQDQSFDLIQTLDDHASSVTDVQFLDNATKLISISSDRTVLIRKAAIGDEAFAFLPVRVITLKSSPVSFTVPHFDSSVLVVATTDRQVQKFEINTGRLLKSYRPVDPLGNESVLLSSLQAVALDTLSGINNILLATSSTDRSIRVHDFETGSLLGHEFAQANVCAVAVLQDRNSGPESTPKVVSCGHDGTVIAYNLVGNTQRFDSPCESTVRVQTPTLAAPLRKTLTKAEFAEFHKVLEEKTDNAATPIRSRSPSRMRRQPSRYSLASRATLPISLAGTNPAASLPKRRASQDHTSKSVSPQNTLKATKPKGRPGLDPRRRSKSAALLNDLNTSALCDTLRTFRARLNSSTGSKIDTDARKELRMELELTFQALLETDKVTLEVPPLPKTPNDENFDTYLAKIIDERLALQPKEKDDLSLGDGDGVSSSKADQVEAGAQEGVQSV